MVSEDFGDGVLIFDESGFVVKREAVWPALPGNTVETLAR